MFSWQTYGGISRYIVEQMRGLQALGQTVSLPQHFFSENVYLNQLPGFQRNSMAPFPFKGKKWIQLQLGKNASKKALETYRPDVFHPTYFDPYFLKTVQKHGIPWVITVHDMIHEIYHHGSRGFFSLDKNVVQHKRLLVELAHAVITVSENTKQDLLRFCPEVSPEKVHVVYHGNLLKPVESDPLISGNPYLLFVGQRKQYKNFLWMLQELQALLHEMPLLQVKCVGGGPFNDLENDKIKVLGLQDKVQYKTVKTDEELAIMYRNARCFIFPSLYEGFGMPLVEAMACGCPVLIPEGGALSEIGGGAAMSFQHHIPGSLLESTRKILLDKSLRDDFTAKGKKRAELFTWEKSVAAHVNIYQQICG
ncbi:MAG: glycosyltransferase family 4 protein [Saprospiraceae bacterium]|nr:glycosyltransferase family 4 protein [Saprospiraceae bacterium]